MASSVVHDERTLSIFRQDVFWISLGLTRKKHESLLAKYLERKLAFAPIARYHDNLDDLEIAGEIGRRPKSARGNRRCLLVLDSLQEVEVLNVFAEAGFHLLVTAREWSVVPPRWSGTFTQVGHMTIRETLELLRLASGAGRALPEEEAKKVKSVAAQIKVFSLRRFRGPGILFCGSHVRSKRQHRSKNDYCWWIGSMDCTDSAVHGEKPLENCLELPARTQSCRRCSSGSHRLRNATSSNRHSGEINETRAFACCSLAKRS